MHYGSITKEKMNCHEGKCTGTKLKINVATSGRRMSTRVPQDARNRGEVNTDTTTTFGPTRRYMKNARVTPFPLF